MLSKFSNIYPPQGIPILEDPYITEYKVHFHFTFVSCIIFPGFWVEIEKKIVLDLARTLNK